MRLFVLADQDDPENPEQGCHVINRDPFHTTAATEVCPQCNSPLEGAYWARPHVARVSSTDCKDLIPGAGLELILSTRTWRAITESGLRGLRPTEPLTTEPPTSMEYVVSRPSVTVTRLDESRSHLTWVRPPKCDVCRMGVRKSVGPIVLDESTWDGRDIFVASGLYGLKLVSERFVQTINSAGLAGFSFIAAEDYREA